MSADAAVPDLEAIRREYDERKPQYELLTRAMERLLRNALDAAWLEVHALTGRVKAFDSFMRKVRLKNYCDPWAQCVDLAGLRVVCLYREDMEKAENVVRESFEVQEEVVRRKTAPDCFGYRDSHFVVAPRPGYLAGEEAEAAKGRRCEIQVRTVGMDAWDALSHHLDYKKRIGVPPGSRRDLLALSAHFELSDTHFEMLRTRVRELRMAQYRAIGLEDDDPLDVETLPVLLERMYPEREQSSLEPDRRILAYEFGRNGVFTVGEARCILEGAKPALAKLQSRGSALGHDPFTREGAARLSAMLVRRGWSYKDAIPADLLELVEPVAQEFGLRDSP